MYNFLPFAAKLNGSKVKSGQSTTSTQNSPKLSPNFELNAVQKDRY